jgi:hypothetical protein
VSERLEQAAELFRRLSRDAGRELEYDRAGVAWADQYVQGVRPVENDDQLRVHTALVGSYLGQALISTRGGAWEELEGEWTVQLAGGERAYPFRRTLEQLQQGDEHSILAWFEGYVPADAPSAADAEGEPVTAATLRETAERFLQVIRDNGGPEEYGEDAVAFVDRFVNGARPLDAELMDQYVALVGAVLGESLIAVHGGAWERAAGVWKVRTAAGDELFPFARAREQIDNGEESSILAYFQAVG